MWITFNYLKTNSTKLAHYRLEIRKVIELFYFLFLTQHPIFFMIKCTDASDNQSTRLSIYLPLILVSGNWAHALDSTLPKDQMTQTETYVLPDRYHLIKIK